MTSRPTKRWERVALALAFGAVVTFLTSTAIPLTLLALGLNKHTLGSRQPWTAPNGQRCGVQHSHLGFSDWYQVRPSRMEDSFLPMGAAAQLPSWVATPRSNDSSLYHIDTAGHGWPLRALASESWLYRVPPDPVGNVWREDLRWNLVLLTLPRGRIIMPLRPVPLGLVVNTCFFAAAALSVTFCTRTLRRTMRRRRGQCAECGYSLIDIALSSPCPECGGHR